MKIEAIQAYKLFLRLPAPLTISFHTFEFTEAVLINIVTDKGQSGWGEAAPFKLVTGDSYTEVVSELAATEDLIGKEIAAVESFYDRYLINLQCASLRAALDFAVHDLVAQSQAKPLYGLYRDHPRLIPNCVTVFIQGSQLQTQSEAARILKKYPELKLLKIKLQGEGDFERCQAIKKVAKSDLKYVLDANQGFNDPQLAVKELNAIVDMLGTVVMIEEPCKKGDLVKAQIVTAGVGKSLVVADESCCSMNDMERIIDAKAFKGINIKLQKTGGITPAKRLAKAAQSANMQVMLGQMFETPLSTAAGVNFATTTPNVALTDLDMDLELPEFCSGQCEFIAGSRVPQTLSGFGFKLDFEKLKLLQDKQLIEFQRLL